MQLRVFLINFSCSFFVKMFDLKYGYIEILVILYRQIWMKQLDVKNYIHKQRVSIYQTTVQVIHHKLKAFTHRIRLFVQKNKGIIKNHTLGWLIFWVIDFCFAFANRGGNINLDYPINVIFFTTFFYLITYFALLPHFSTNRLKAIFLALLMLVSFVFLKYIFTAFVFDGNPTRKGLTFVSFEVWRLSTATFYAIAYWVYLQSLKDQKMRYLSEIKLIETQDVLLSTEIKFLKAQINPHCA